MSEDDDDWGDEDIPWADPQIRLQFEAALGRFILHHNECDVLLTRLIDRCLVRLGNPPALQKIKTGEFSKRLDNLIMLQALPLKLELQHLPLTKLRQLNIHRNIVAHGHFEQNPFDGDYVLIRNAKRFAEYSSERLIELGRELHHINGHLSAVVAFYDPPLMPEEDVDLRALAKDPWAEEPDTTED